MIKNQKLKKFFIILSSILLIIIIIFAPLSHNLYNFKFYDRLYEKNGVYKSLDKEDVVKLTASVFAFFKSGEPFEEFKLKTGIEYFNSNEISHLNDVRILLSRILLLFYISSVLLLLFILMIIDKSYQLFLKNLSTIMIISSSVVLFILAALYFLGNNFWSLFEDFHLLFFPQGNWAFPEGSLIITIFPFGFFYDFFFKLVLTSAIISLVLFLTGLTVFITINRLQKRKNNEK